MLSGVRHCFDFPLHHGHVNIYMLHLVFHNNAERYTVHLNKQLIFDIVAKELTMHKKGDRNISLLEDFPQDVIASSGFQQCIALHTLYS